MKIRRICSSLTADLENEFLEAGVNFAPDILSKINPNLLFKALQFEPAEQESFLQFLREQKIRHWPGQDSVLLTFGFTEEITRLKEYRLGMPIYEAFQNSRLNQFTWNLPRGNFVIDRPQMMGILNVTPDSFSDGGQFNTVERALRHAEEMLESGADMIDIGAESTRPGAEALSEEEEWRRLKDIIPAIRKLTDVPLSLDTYKAEIARRGLEAGIDVINDISGLSFDPRMKEVVAQHKVPLIIMHIKGTPKNMQQSPQYKLLMEEIWQFLDFQIVVAKNAGITQLAVDPGIGFGKRIEDNFEIIRRLKEFAVWGVPVLLGPSRKTFLKGAKNLPPAERVWGTAAAISAGIMNGATILRIHDVEEMARVKEILTQVLSSKAK